MKNINQIDEFGMIFGLCLHIDDELDKVFTRGTLRDSIISKLKVDIITIIKDVWLVTSLDPKDK